MLSKFLPTPRHWVTFTNYVKIQTDSICFSQPMVAVIHLDAVQMIRDNMEKAGFTSEEEEDWLNVAVNFPGWGKSYKNAQALVDAIEEWMDSLDGSVVESSEATPEATEATEATESTEATPGATPESSDATEDELKLRVQFVKAAPASLPPHKKQVDLLVRLPAQEDGSLHPALQSSVQAVCAHRLRPDWGFPHQHTNGTVWRESRIPCVADTAEQALRKADELIARYMCVLKAVKLAYLALPEQDTAQAETIEVEI